MNCLIIEDQLPAQRILKKYIEDTVQLKLVGVYQDALQALDVLKDLEVDLIFLDIHLPKISGIDFLKTLQNPPKIILTTAFQDYALESYEYQVVDYLLKPFSFQRFLQAVARASKEENTTSVTKLGKKEELLEELYVKSGYDFIRLKTQDLLFIVSDTDYTELHIKDEKIVSNESLKYWLSVLDSQSFRRVHKSHIINTSKIVKVSGNQVFLEHEKIIPIGRAYKNELMSWLSLKNNI
ncbi:response regulator transcription factor [Flavicella sp.]|uniref:LytR/AlgR family response regulator transcription factor n=1 Tax=Flavicella sp. TaxID=2957742 RepID=UPI00261D81A1|nr:response regulator transcription factor [Flavicella sp.]MDG1805517.1 response regulator transcription factor [Flavicella sp.]